MRLYIIFVLLFTTIIIIGQTTENRLKLGVNEEHLISPPATAPSVHSGTITNTKDGLLLAYFGGKYEGHQDVAIFTSRYQDGKWSSPTEIINGQINESVKKACYNPVLFTYPDGEIILFYKIGKNVQDWDGYLVRSTNDGYTWSKPEKLPDTFLGPTKNRPLLIGEKLLCPSSTEVDGWKVHFEVTEDRGKTWRKTSEIIQPNWNIIQASILTHPDGKLQFICRSQEEYIASAFSIDDGEHWTEVFATHLPNNNSGIDGITLDNGEHLIVYNHVKSKESAFIANKRNPLNIALSSDGIKWNASLILEDSSLGEYSYPSVIQTNDGLVHIVYTWHREKIKHVVINPKNLQQTAFDGDSWPK